MDTWGLAQVVPSSDEHDASHPAASSSHAPHSPPPAPASCHKVDAIDLTLDASPQATRSSLKRQLPRLTSSHDTGVDLTLDTSPQSSTRSFLKRLVPRPTSSYDSHTVGVGMTADDTRSLVPIQPSIGPDRQAEPARGQDDQGHNAVWVNRTGSDHPPARSPSGASYHLKTLRELREQVRDGAEFAPIRELVDSMIEKACQSPQVSIVYFISCSPSS